MKPRTQDKIIGTLFLICSLLGMSALFAGCTTVYTSDKATIIKSHVLGVRISSANGTAATPELALGNVFTEVYIIPTATNQVYIPRITDTSGSKSGWNPLAVGIEESIGVGDVNVNVGTTNGSGGSAILPKLNAPK